MTDRSFASLLTVVAGLIVAGAGAALCAAAVFGALTVFSVVAMVGALLLDSQSGSASTDVILSLLTIAAGVGLVGYGWRRA